MFSRSRIFLLKKHVCQVVQLEILLVGLERLVTSPTIVHYIPECFLALILKNTGFFFLIIFLDNGIDYFMLLDVRSLCVLFGKNLTWGLHKNVAVYKSEIRKENH